MTRELPVERLKLEETSTLISAYILNYCLSTNASGRRNDLGLLQYRKAQVYGALLRLISDRFHCRYDSTYLLLTS